jgi:penicillin-binding protein 1A
MARRTRRRRRLSHTSKWRKILVPLGVLFAALAVAGGAAGTWAIDVYNSAPPLAALQPVQKGRSSAIYGADGSLIGFIRSSNVRQPVKSDQLPEELKDATIAIEDRGFFDHGPIDYDAIVRAIFKNIEAGRTVEGASTITQQLVRNLYIQHPEQTIKRKLIEAHLAADMEKAHSKDWILTEYLNTAPYGTVEGQTAVGAEAAAQTYFAKPAKDLDLTEAALIAGLPQAPSEYNPFLDPRAATQRRNDVLEAMEEEDYITSEEYREAVDSDLGLQPGNKYRVIRDPFLFDLVQQELIDK